MKKLIALAMVCAMLLSSAALAAEWPEGRGASQPYSGVPAVDLNETMGYIILFPREKLPAQGFCDVLEIYLPREDIVRGTGFAHLYEGSGDSAEEIAAIDFSRADSVGLRALTEEELDSLMWGSGTCIELRLPRSLRLGASYYVLMDEGCFSAASGKVASLAITNPEAWAPVLLGDYGVSGLYYAEAPEDTSEDEVFEIAIGEDAEAQETPAEAEAVEPACKLNPKAGDIVSFDLVMGGDAAFAVIFSDNDSVDFPVLEYTASGSVTGRVTKDEVDWGVVFLSQSGDVVKVVDLSR